MESTPFFCFRAPAHFLILLLKTHMKRTSHVFRSKSEMIKIKPNANSDQAEEVLIILAKLYNLYRVPRII